MQLSRKDFFVSYNKADRYWGEWIAWQLEEAGFSVVIQAWDFRPGSNFILEMQKAATEAERTIAVLSNGYLDALYTQPEWAAAFASSLRCFTWAKMASVSGSFFGGHSWPPFSDSSPAC